MNTTLRLLSGVLIVLVAQFAWAANTGKISGKVTDEKTKEPLVGVNVLITGTKQGGTSDVQGDFFIANVPVGTYALRASQVGYKEILFTDVRVRADATTEITIVMQQTVLDIKQEIVVIAQRPPVQKDNTATRMYVESAEIRNLPVATIGEVLQNLPSVNVDNGVMSVRGGGLNEVSFLIDGSRARNPNDQTPYTSINLSSIQEMEVITGSYSAEYGEARSGVFNIITKEGTDQYRFWFEGRYTPAGVKHWGPSLYDPSSTEYWENTHARHLQWWIDYPDQWTDYGGRLGNDPLCAMTPQQAYDNYLATHQPLTNYDKVPSYSTELSIGGPIPGIDKLTFFFSGRYRVEAPLMGNSYLDKGQFFDGTAKISYQLDMNTKILLSGFLGTEKTSWGIGGGPDYFWASTYGNDSRYAYYDWAGYPTTSTNGQTLKLTSIVNDASMYEVRLSRVFARRAIDALPGDPVGWSQTSWTTDLLRAGVKGGDGNRIGYNTTGYYYRYDDANTDWTFNGAYSNQFSKNVQIKAGGEFTYYTLEHFNESKSPPRLDSATYNPYQGAVYAQTKLEFSGFIMNAGLRFDFYAPNNTKYLDIFDPMHGPTEKSDIFTQFSPRLGISHPIDEYTVLHFSYGHFFQRTAFFDYGEGNDAGGAQGSLTTFLVRSDGSPWVLGNRDVKPSKTVAYELGIERNFFTDFVLGVTAYYKDIRNTLHYMKVTGYNDLSYSTIVNGDYADVRGFEVSLRKLASQQSWGSTWGYINFTTQVTINGTSGDPQSISPAGVAPATEVGDYISHQDPRLKAGIYYETPSDWSFMGGLLSRLSFSFDYVAIFPNEMRFGDYIEYNGQKYLRPVDQNTNLRIRKDFTLASNRLRLGVYAEIRNLFNNKWINLDAFSSLSSEDLKRLVESDYTDLPNQNGAGEPILELAMYRNLPRSVTFGVTMEF